MHLSLDIHLGYAHDRRQRLQADRPALAAAIPLRARIAFGTRRAHNVSATGLARRRAGELVPGRC